MRTFSGQRRPIITLVGLADPRKERLIHGHREFTPARAGPIKRRAVGMNIDHRHSAAGRDPPQFLPPDFGGLLAQDNKQSRVLSQGVGQFDITTAVRSRNPKWKNGVGTLRLGLKWIGIES